MFNFFFDDFKLLTLFSKYICFVLYIENVLYVYMYNIMHLGMSNNIAMFKCKSKILKL